MVCEESGLLLPSLALSLRRRHIPTLISPWLLRAPRADAEPVHRRDDGRTPQPALVLVLADHLEQQASLLLDIRLHLAVEGRIS